MALPVFPQNTIAIVWDFDKTLLPKYMQGPLFEHYGVDESAFWGEVQALTDFYQRRDMQVSADTVYLSHMLSYVRAGQFADLSKARLREFGTALTFYEGLPDFFPALAEHIQGQERFAKHDITVEHYIVSTGLRQIILGSAIAPHVENVWACELIPEPAPPGFLENEPDPPGDDAVVSDVGFTIDNTTKTRAIFEINKGVNVYPDEISVNDEMDISNRRVPFENMIYIADGPSDVPVFSVLNQYDGRTLGVYNPDSKKEFNQVLSLQQQGRIQAMAAAEYQLDAQVGMTLTAWLDQIAEGIVATREESLRSGVGKPPRHIIERPTEPPPAEPATSAVTVDRSQPEPEAPQP